MPLLDDILMHDMCIHILDDHLQYGFPDCTQERIKDED